MATLKDYFALDANTMCLSKTYTVGDANSLETYSFEARLHLNFEANALYVSYYFEKTTFLNCPALFGLSKLDEVLKFREDTYMEAGMLGEKKMKSSNMVFTGRIFIYDENVETAMYDDEVLKQAEMNGHQVQFRRETYAVSRANAEHPVAFISHDSRDKEIIARYYSGRFVNFGMPSMVR